MIQLDPIDDFSSSISHIIKNEFKKMNSLFKDDLIEVLNNRGITIDMAPSDIALYYPFWITHDLDIPMKDKIVETIIKYNFWMEIHILVQDDLIDRKYIYKNDYKNILFSNYFLLESLMQIEDLSGYVPMTSIRDVVPLYEEYMNCILKEKKHINSASHVWTEEDLRNMGKKFSLIIINNIILSKLSESEKDLLNLNSFIENFHIYLQMLDDIKDWRTDLINKNYTYFLSKIISEYNLTGKIEVMEEFEYVIYYSDIVKRTLEKGLEYLHRSKSNIEYLDNMYLNKYIKQNEEQVKFFLLNREQHIDSLTDGLRLIL